MLVVTLWAIEYNMYRGQHLLSTADYNTIPGLKLFILLYFVDLSVSWVQFNKIAGLILYNALLFVDLYNKIIGLTLYIALLFVDLSVDTRPSLRLCYRSGSRKCMMQSATIRTPKVVTLPCPSSSCHSKRWVICFNFIFGGSDNGHLNTS